MLKYRPTSRNDEGPNIFTGHKISDMITFWENSYSTKFNDEINKKELDCTLTNTPLVAAELHAVPIEFEQKFIKKNSDRNLLDHGAGEHQKKLSRNHDHDYHRPFEGSSSRYRSPHGVTH